MHGACVNQSRAFCQTGVGYVFRSLDVYQINLVLVAGSYVYDAREVKEYAALLHLGKDEIPVGHVAVNDFGSVFGKLFRIFSGQGNGLDRFPAERRYLTRLRPRCPVQPLTIYFILFTSVYLFRIFLKMRIPLQKTNANSEFY